MLKQIKGSGLLCGSNGQRQLSLIKVVGVQIIYALSSKADLSTHWLDYAPLPTPTPHSLPSFHPILHFSSQGELHLAAHHHTWCCWGGPSGIIVYVYAKQLSWVLCWQVMQLDVPPQGISLSVDGSVGSTWGDAGAGIRAKGGWEFFEWRAVSACRGSMVTAAAAAEAEAGERAQVALATATGPGQVSKVFTQHKDRLGSARLGSPRSGSFVSLINCLSIIISCSLTSPDTVRGSVTVSVTSTSSCSHRVRPRPRSRPRPRCR